MKNLKKFFAVLVVLTLMVSSIVVPVSAAENIKYSDEAQKLYDLGLYKGISTEVFNPDLSSTLNRETGVVMLLRIVGLEKAALDMSAADVTEALSKFKDAKDISPWAKNQVAYGVKNGLIVGTTETTFSPKASLDSKAYCTLILRQLGYTVEAGAQYDAAAATLQEKGGLTAEQAADYANKSPLIKDDLVGISYGALKAVDKDGKVLFVKLIEAGVFTAEAAGKVGLETAKIASVKAENGKVTVEFDKAPVVEPVAADFTVTQTIYGSDPTTVTATVYYSADSKTAELTVAPVAQADAEQKVIMSVSFKGGDAVSAAEFVVPSLATYDVKTVRGIANKKVEVILKSEIASTNKSDFTVKDSAGAAVAVEGAFLSSDKKSVVVTTAALTANALYTMTIKGKDYKFVGIAAETDKPKLTTAVGTSNTKVTLTYNERVDEETALNPANYTIANLTISKVEFGKDGNGNPDKTKVVLTTSSQTAGTIYKVVVANVTDLAGNVIDADNDEAQFGGIPADTTKPQLTAAVGKTNTKVELTFNEDMDKVTAENPANYTIANLTVLKAELSAKDAKIVTLTTSAQAVGTIYKVVVAGVNDEAGNPIDPDKDEAQFGGIPADTTKPELVSAVASTNTSVKVTFNEDMDKTTAENPANYTIANLTITKAELNEDDNKLVTLTTSAQVAGTIYKLIVANVNDASGNPINADKDEAQFGGMPADTTKPKLISVVAIDNTHVKVAFNEPMDDTLGASAYCYNLGELGYPSDVAKSTDPGETGGDYWILTTASQSAKVYKLSLSYITDPSGNVIDPDYDEMSFAGIGNPDTTAPKVATAVAVNKNTITITFNEEIDNVDASDFSFELVSGADTATTKITSGSPDGFKVADDKKSVTVEYLTAYMTAGCVYKVTVTGVTDTATPANSIDTSANTANFAGLSTDNPAPKLASAVLMNNQTLKLTFNEKISVNPSALVIGDFTFSPAVAGIDIENAELSKDNTSLTLYFTGATFATSTIYTVTITGTSKIKDEIGIQAFSATADDAKTNFAGIPTAATSPKISSIIAVDKNTVDVTFDQKVDVSSLVVGDIDVVVNGTSVSYGVGAAKVREEGDTGTKIRIFFNDTAKQFTPGTIYKLTLNEAHILNLNGTAMATADNNALFAAVSTANAAPAIAAVSKINNTLIKVTFTEKISTLGANGAAGFAITGATITGASLITTGDNAYKEVELTLSAALTPGVKTLTITAGTTILDEAGVGKADESSKMDFAY
jgi:hypothetical protein